MTIVSQHEGEGTGDGEDKNTAVGDSSETVDLIVGYLSWDTKEEKTNKRLFILELNKI